MANPKWSVVASNLKFLIKTQICIACLVIGMEIMARMSNPCGTRFMTVWKVIVLFTSGDCFLMWKISKQVNSARDDILELAQCVYGVIGVYSIGLCYFDENAKWDMPEGVAVVQLIGRVKIFQKYNSEDSPQNRGNDSTMPELIHDATDL